MSKETEVRYQIPINGIDNSWDILNKIALFLFKFELINPFKKFTNDKHFSSILK